jgi:CheY-like chemotaxis protein
VVYGIVRQNGGFVTVDTAPGKGASFAVHLPAAPRDTRETPPARAAGPGGGSEEILVVDDEPSVLEVAQRTLSEAGYRVVTARTGEEALRVATGRPGLSLVLTDVLMPGLGGRELVRRLADVRPALRVLVTSGQPDGAGDVLQKPFSAEELLGEVRKALDGVTGTGRTAAPDTSPTGPAPGS